MTAVVVEVDLECTRFYFGCGGGGCCFVSIK